MRLQILLLICACGLLGSCISPATSTRGGKPAAGQAPPPGTGNATSPDASLLAAEGSKSLATIESVHADLEPGIPARAKVVISGLLHDGATRIQSVEQRRSTQGVEITVTTTRPGHSSAGVALIPFERTVSVDLSGMKPGPCRITANGTSTMLMVP